MSLYASFGSYGDWSAVVETAANFIFCIWLQKAGSSRRRAKPPDFVINDPMQIHNTFASNIMRDKEILGRNVARYS